LPIEITQKPAKGYIIKFPELKLKYEFIYLDNELRDIIQWSESYPSAFDGQIRSSVATRKSVLWTDYWSKNYTQDSTLRKEIMLNSF